MIPIAAQGLIGADRLRQFERSQGSDSVGGFCDNGRFAEAAKIIKDRVGPVLSGDSVLFQLANSSFGYAVYFADKVAFRTSIALSS